MAKDPSISKLISDFKNTEASPFGPPYESGIYGVFVSHRWNECYSEHLLYIGSSKNVAKRVLRPDHYYRIIYNRFSGTDVLVYTKTLLCEEPVESEKILIKYLRPKLNKAHKY